MKMPRVVIMIASIILLIFVFWQIRSRSTSSESSTSASQIWEGTFRNTKTGELFIWADPYGYLNTCIEISCTHVYFDVDAAGKILQIRSVDTSPIIGEITKTVLSYGGGLPVSAEYAITYSYEGNHYTASYNTGLCVSYKGGGKTCDTPAHEGQPVIVTPESGNLSHIQGVTFFQHMLIADVIGMKLVEKK